MQNMNLEKIISRIEESINEAHAFSKNLGESRSIHRNYLIDKLNDIPPNEIHCGLLKLKDQGKIDFSPDSDVILLTPNIKM
jgi:hypothetical protein